MPKLTDREVHDVGYKHNIAPEEMYIYRFGWRDCEREVVSPIIQRIKDIHAIGGHSGEMRERLWKLLSEEGYI